MFNGQQPTAAAPQTGTGRNMSAAGRKRIAAAQLKRWATAKGVPKRKPRLSAAGRAAIVAALKRRWALKRAASEKRQAVAKRKVSSKKLASRKAAWVVAGHWP